MRGRLGDGAVLLPCRLLAQPLLPRLRQLSPLGTLQRSWKLCLPGENDLPRRPGEAVP